MFVQHTSESEHALPVPHGFPHTPEPLPDPDPDPDPEPLPEPLPCVASIWPFSDPPQATSTATNNTHVRLVMVGEGSPRRGLVSTAVHWHHLACAAHHVHETVTASSTPEILREVRSHTATATRPTDSR